MALLEGTVTVSALAEALLPKLQAALGLRWIALAVDQGDGQQIVDRSDDCPLTVGERLSSRTTIGSGCLIVPCWFGPRQVATLVASPQSGSSVPDLQTALLEISDSVAAIVQTAGQRPAAEPANTDHVLRVNKLSLLSLLAAGLAHEVRNPLLVIRSYVELIGEELDLLDGNGPSQGPEVLDRLRLFHTESLRAVRQAMSVLTDYRAISTDSRQVDRINLGHLSREAVQLVRPAFGLKLSIEVVSTPAPAVSAKRSQVLQILLNLIINACQAAGPHGQVLVSIATAPKGAGVAVTVSNNGTSIPPEALPGLFEPLVTGKEESGTGLGLAVSQALAQRMGGLIDAESRPNWTTFRLCLPISES
jgi:signal transduction histidine kinase